MSTATKALSITVQPTWDAEVLDWFNVRVPATGATVSESTRLAANAFMLAIKSAGLRMKIYRLNLFAGSGPYGEGAEANMGSLACPLIRDQGAAHDTFTGPNSVWSYNEAGSNGGLQTSAGGYCDTGLVPGTAFPSNASGHFSIYNRTPTDQNGLCGTQKQSSPYTTIGISPGAIVGGTVYLLMHDFNQDAIFSDSLGVGLYTVSRESTSIKAAYKNGTARARHTASPATSPMDTRTMLIFAMRSAAGIGNHCNKRLAGYSIGLGLTATEVADFYNAWQAFQAALGRAMG